MHVITQILEGSFNREKILNVVGQSNVVSVLKNPMTVVGKNTITLGKKLVCTLKMSFKEYFCRLDFG